MSLIERNNKSVMSLEEEIAAMEQQALESVVENKEEEDQEEIVLETVSKPEEEPLDKEEATWKKRHGDLRRHSQKTEKELKDRITALEEKLKTTDTGSMPTSKEDVEDWVRRHPQVASIIKALAKDGTEEISSKVANLEKRREEFEREKAEATIRKAHSDFDDIISSDEFHDWAENQPKRVQDSVYSEDANDVIWAINTYKMKLKLDNVKPESETAKVVSRRSMTKEPTGTTKGRFSESMVQRMSTDEYLKNADAIDASMRDGTFVYDISAGAR